MRTENFNDAEIEAIFAALDARLADMTPAMQDIGEAWLTSTEERFERGVAPDGRPWAAKSPTTLAKYGVLGGNSLRQPLIGPTRILSTTVFYDAQQDAVSMASNAIQAAVMQYGAEKGSLGGGSPWGDIPARPFLGVSAEDKTMIVDVLTEYLQDAEG